MAICSKCKKHVKDGIDTCPYCGARIRAGGNAGRSFGITLGEGEDYSGAYSASDISENRLSALLCYIPIVFLYPIFTSMKKSQFVKFHANQGLVLFIAEIAVSFLLKTLMAITSHIPIIAQLLALPLYLIERIVWLAFLYFTVSGALRAYNGKAKELPIIGRIRIIK